MRSPLILVILLSLSGFGAGALHSAAAQDADEELYYDEGTTSEEYVDEADPYDSESYDEPAEDAYADSQDDTSDSSADSGADDSSTPPNSSTGDFASDAAQELNQALDDIVLPYGAANPGTPVLEGIVQENEFCFQNPDQC